MKHLIAFLEIQNGKYIRGQLDKGVLGSSSKGLLHRIRKGL